MSVKIILLLSLSHLRAIWTTRRQIVRFVSNVKAAFWRLQESMTLTSCDPDLESSRDILVQLFSCIMDVLDIRAEFLCFVLKLF